MKELKIISKVHGVKTILLDDEDHERLKGFSWTVLKYAHTFYAQRVLPRNGGKQRHIRIHREILGVTGTKQFIDHINGNALDNRKINLRLATNSQNQANRESRVGSSQFKGVWWVKGRNKWRAYVKGVHLGLFDSELEAAEAYNKKAVEIYGEFAKLNKTA